MNKSTWLICGLLLWPSTTTIGSEMFLQVWQERIVPAVEAALISSVSIDKGNVVHANDIIIQMENRDQRIARDRAILEMEVATKRVESAQANIELKQSLLEFSRRATKRANESNVRATDSVSIAELEKLQRNQAQAEFDLREAKHELQILQSTVALKAQSIKAAENALAKRRVEAPISGEIVDVLVRADEWVEPGQPLVRIMQTSELFAETLVPSSIGTAALVGHTVNMTVDMPDQEATQFDGIVDFVSPEVGAVDNQVRIRIRISNAQSRLRPGFQVRLTTPSLVHPLPRSDADGI